MFGNTPIFPFVIPAVALYLMLGILTAEIFEFLYRALGETRAKPERSKEILIIISWPITLAGGIIIIILGLLTAIFSICAFIFGCIFCLLITRFLNLLESFYDRETEEEPAKPTGRGSEESPAKMFMKALLESDFPPCHKPPIVLISGGRKS